ncbi:rhamnosyltransferase [Agreia bicolorata]|uniref:Rhamnosyltransferase n=1 Tax=Agreia bicolorata TaxID=110935 RepID=A0A1T4XXH7_9MICO|nr:glycosyltransferase [Agreia bicolorata]SKA93755.1 rhamnosyltransferase [Agreia bicolorata]
MPRAHARAPSTRVVAVISAFNPGPALLDACASLLSQTRSVTIVDDGSTIDVTEILDSCAAAGCQIVLLGQNSGIASALNAGVDAAFARAPEAEFVLTLDQDSTLQADYVERALSAFEAATAAGVRVGLVAPHSVQGLPSRVAEVRNGVVLGLEPIQSGLVIPRSVWRSAGPFRAGLFIDSVDTEYFMRLSDFGFETVLAPGTHLSHSLGSRFHPTIFGRRLRFRGRDVSLVRSSPFRYYYIARNRVLMNRAFGSRHRAWSIKETLLDARHFAIVLALSPNRLTLGRLIAAGWLDGVRGRQGRMPSVANRIARR